MRKISDEELNEPFDDFERRHGIIKVRDDTKPSGYYRKESKTQFEKSLERIRKWFRKISKQY